MINTLITIFVLILIFINYLILQISNHYFFKIKKTIIPMKKSINNIPLPNPK